MNRYAIWNKQDNIITPTGKVFSPEEWMELYPVAKLDNITIVCSAGEINGGFFGTLGQMISLYESQGVDFSSCLSDEEKIEAINSFDAAKEEEQRIASEEAKAAEDLKNTSFASIAASLEYQNILTLDDTEETETVSMGVAKTSSRIAGNSNNSDSINNQKDRIIFNYSAGFWSAPMVKMAVKKGVITKEQYEEITGNEYNA